MKIRVAIVGAVLVVVYVTTIVLYANTGLGHPTQVATGQPDADGTTVTLDLQEVHATRGEMIANVTVSPAEKLLDPTTHGLTEDLSISIHSAATPTTRAWQRGTVPGVFPVTLTMAGDPGAYPFDHYESGPITVDLLRGANSIPDRVSASVFDRVPGWMFKVDSGADTRAAISRVNIQRSPSTAAFVVLILGALVTIAGLGIVVAVQTLRDRRAFQPPMTTWFAALLFAVVPLRNALPDAPPIGIWIDVTVVLWVVVALVASMGVYVACWWRQVKPPT